MQASYTTDQSALTRLDVRAKMTVSIVAAVATVLLSNLWAETLLFAVSLIYLLSMKRFKLAFFAYAAVAVMMALSIGCVLLLSHFVPAFGKGMSLGNLAVPFLRLLITMNVVLPLAFTSRIQTILRALQNLRLPFCIYLPAAVIIRFIPTFANDIRQVWESLKIRGWRLNPLSLTLHPIVTTRLLFTPLLFRSLKTGDELGVAAELKGLSQTRVQNRSNGNAWTKAEWLLIVVCFLAVAAAVYLQIQFPVEIKGGMR